MDTLQLLTEFPPVSTEAWEQVIGADLKGADHSKLVWTPEEGLEIQPYYRAADLDGIPHLDSGEIRSLRGARAQGGWQIRAEIDAADPEEANHAAREAVAAGADEIAFTHVTVAPASDLALLLANLNEIPVHFAAMDQAAIRLLIDRLQSRPHSAPISAAINPLADSAFSGEVLASAVPNFVPFTIDAAEFHERAATCAEEIGFALAAGIDFVAEMLDRGIDPNRIADSLAFSFAIGPAYFLQIAKLRAFRLACAQAAQNLGVSPDHANPRIHARTARWNETLYAAHNNILRSTTEAMSAIIGSADSVTIAPFDECYVQPGAASHRLAVNIQIILRLEAQLGRVADPGAGSYYLESLTNQIARQAWRQMQKIESAGGFRKSAAIISETLDQRTAARHKSVAQRRSVLAGVNRFANPAETISNPIDAARLDLPARAARSFEQLRLRTESHAAKNSGHVPQILLAEFGDAKMRAARSQFSADFLACAGLAAHAQCFATAADIASFAADLIVLCSSDDEYLTAATDLCAALRARENGPAIIVAGNPACAAQLKSLDIAEFIHLGSNAVEVLTAIQRLLGIEN